MSGIDEIYAEVSAFSATQKLQLVDKILRSIYPVNKGVEASWAKEAQERIEAHDGGHVSCTTEKDVFAKYENSYE